MAMLRHHARADASVRAHVPVWLLYSARTRDDLIYGEELERLAGPPTLALPFSVAAWVYQPAAARGEFRSILATDDQPGAYAGLFFQTMATGQLSMSYADGGTVGADHRRTLDSNAPIAADAWVHVVATVRGPTDMTLYIDGAPVPATYSGTGGPLVHSAAPARIGAFSIVPANRPWLGQLDEVRIYACSLDAAEVATLFAQL